jgi:maltooligosyltrehalose trehalohydrolase
MLRRDRIVPHLDDCRSLGAAVLGPAAVRASWALGEGTLTVLANFGSGAVPCGAPDGVAIFSLGEVENEAGVLRLGPRSFRASLS